jgi:PTH1 family peptidyl-tRNA hydrolase
MHLVIGLGNPGKSYENTRHNAGFLAIDFLAQVWNASPFSEDFRFRALLSSAMLNGEKLLLVKPQTYMNLSGESAQALVKYFKISFENILLLHDDKDFALGELRLAENSSSAGHRGVKNIFDTLGTQHISRIRIGIGIPPENIPTDEYVLSRFSSEERIALETAFPDIQALAETFLQKDLR